MQNLLSDSCEQKATLRFDSEHGRRPTVNMVEMPKGWLYSKCERQIYRQYGRKFTVFKAEINRGENSTAYYITLFNSLILTSVLDNMFSRTNHERQEMKVHWEMMGIQKVTAPSAKWRRRSICNQYSQVAIAGGTPLSSCRYLFLYNSPVEFDAQNISIIS